MNIWSCSNRLFYKVVTVAVFVEFIGIGTVVAVAAMATTLFENSLV